MERLYGKFPCRAPEPRAGVGKTMFQEIQEIPSLTNYCKSSAHRVFEKERNTDGSIPFSPGKTNNLKKKKKKKERKKKKELKQKTMVILVSM